MPFDYVVHTGELIILDTNEVMLTDEHGQVMAFEGGDIFLDSFEVKAGGMIIAQGPNPLRFFVNDHVTIAGTIDVSGSFGKDVVQFYGQQYPQYGGNGPCGGGDGGTGNIDPSKSCAIGGTGFGPKNESNQGGGGGESALTAIGTGGTPCWEPEDHHPGGGGGGSFATEGEAGFDGTNGNYNLGACTVPDGKSAVDPTAHPKGGRTGLLAFEDSDVTNDFLGIAQFKTGHAGAGSTTTVFVPAHPIFSVSDVGRLMGLVRASGSWEDSTTGCLATPEDVLACPRSRVLLRRIVAFLPNGSITVAPALPAAIQPGDTAIVYGGGDNHAGELEKLRGGCGGGAGGNSINSQWLHNPNAPSGDKAGAGGGGGGGVLEIYCWGPVKLSQGSLRSNGGHGGAGQSTIGFDHIGGGGGGGSGGLIRVQSATSIDARDATIQARGGARGVGAYGSVKDPTIPNGAPGLGHGGRGGKGVIQLHAPFDAAGIPLITFSAGQPVSSNFDPAPILSIPEFTNDPERQRALWFGIK